MKVFDSSFSIILTILYIHLYTLIWAYTAHLSRTQKRQKNKRGLERVREREEEREMCVCCCY